MSIQYSDGTQTMTNEIVTYFLMAVCPGSASLRSNSLGVSWDRLTASQANQHWLVYITVSMMVLEAYGPAQEGLEGTRDDPEETRRACLSHEDRLKY